MDLIAIATAKRAKARRRTLTIDTIHNTLPKPLQPQLVQLVHDHTIPTSAAAETINEIPEIIAAGLAISESTLKLMRQRGWEPTSEPR